MIRLRRYGSPVKRRICRLVGHRWGNSALLIPALPTRGKIEGNHRLTCSRCGEEILCWYGHPVPNVGISWLRHRWRIRIQHWRV